jgi:hypothetical protein
MGAAPRRPGAKAVTDIVEHKATPRAELERQIMDPNIPKNEREWWAAAEIERLREVCKDKTILLKDAYAQNERLRLRVKDLEINSPAQDALREIARLQDHMRELRVALNEIWINASFQDTAGANRICGIAKAALEHKP